VKHRRIFLLSAISLLFITTGLFHLLNPRPFVEIVPSYLPAPEWLVAISGIFEIAGGIGLLVRQTRRLAAIGLILLLVAVVPANIHMLTHHPFFMGKRLPEWLLWLRLPLQPLLMVLIWWCVWGRRQCEKEVF
jgi:uncharacterized membrane protein